MNVSKCFRELDDLRLIEQQFVQANQCELKAEAEIFVEFKFFASITYENLFSFKKLLKLCCLRSG